MAAAAQMVEIWRGGLLESSHVGHAVICDASGTVRESWGDPDAVIFPRSSCKMLQALPLIEHVFSHYRLHIEPRRWRLADSGPDKGDNGDLRWQPLQQLHELGLPAPVKKLLGNPP